MAKWLKRWTTDPGVRGSSPTIATGIFSPRSLLSSAQKCGSGRVSLKAFPPEVYTASFGGDVKPVGPRGTGLNRLFPSPGPR